MKLILPILLVAFLSGCQTFSKEAPSCSGSFEPLNSDMPRYIDTMEAEPENTPEYLGLEL